MKQFAGEVLFLDRDDINTDEIIPAKYLTENSKDALKPYLLEDLELQGFDPGRDIPGKGMIISRRNFGCGSSREHAAWALEENGIYVVAAENFSRIFKQNMFNCGLPALELPPAIIEEMFTLFAPAPPTYGELDIDKSVLRLSAEADGAKINREYAIKLSGFYKELIKVGGWVEFADTRYT